MTTEGHEADQNREVAKYLELPWSREIVAQPTGGFVARVPELDGCFVGADTAEEAFGLLDGALEAWLSLAIEDGLAIPDPRVEDDTIHSGRFSVRVPRTLHRNLVDRANRDGCSLNQIVTTALSAYVAGSGSRVPDGHRDAREPIATDAVRSDQRSIGALKGIAAFLRDRGETNLACVVHAFAAARITEFEGGQPGAREFGLAASTARRAGSARLAATLWQESLRLDSTNLRANSSLGQLLYKDGRYIEAIEYLERAASVDNYARTFVGWARIMLGLDRSDHDLRRAGLLDLTEALRRWAYQNSSAAEKQSWFSHVRRLSHLGEAFTEEAEHLVEFANSNSRWGPTDQTQLRHILARGSTSTDSDLGDELDLEEVGDETS